MCIRILVSNLARLLQKETQKAKLYVPLSTCVVSPNTADEEESNNDKTRETYVDTKKHELDPETISVKDDSNKTSPAAYKSGLLDY